MERLVKIGEKEVGFKATASTTKRYRQKFNRDLFKDIRKLTPKVSGEEELDAEDLDCFMNIAYIMAWQFDSSIPSDPDEWLDGFDMFDIYVILPQLIDLWGLNELGLEEPKKKVEQQSDH